jgi:predicted metal-dependent HD superfamily phosphohydrolase
LKIDNLRLKWDELCKETGMVDPFNKYFNHIMQKYNEPHRYYHTGEHILFCLRNAEYHKINSPEIKLTIWLHDVIYDPTRNDNEQQSCIFANKILQELNVPSESIKFILSMIMDTTHVSPAKSYSGACVADVDMLILAVNKIGFLKYEEDISKEYNKNKHREKYIAGRLNFLRNIEYPIFQTSIFSKYEWEAKENISSLIDLLNKELSI